LRTVGGFSLGEVTNHPGRRRQRDSNRRLGSIFKDKGEVFVTAGFVDQGLIESLIATVATVLMFD